MKGFKGTTYREAIYNYQKEAHKKINSLFSHMHFAWRCEHREEKENVWQSTKNGRYRIGFNKVAPVKVKILDSNLVPISRESGFASEQWYSNNLDQEITGRHNYKTYTTTENIETNRNLIGVTIENKFTIGSGEQAKVKVENETTVSVATEFEKTRQSGKTKGQEEENEITFPIAAHSKVEVERQIDRARMKSTENILIYLDISFYLTGYKSDKCAMFHGSKDRRGYNGKTRVLADFKNTNDFTNFLLGINPRFPNQKRNFLNDKKVKNDYNWLIDNTALQYIEERTYENASFGQCVVREHT